MAELYDPRDILKMCNKVMKTADEMEKSLQKIVGGGDVKEGSLTTYRKHIQDNISEDAEKLMKDIQRRVDSIRKECMVRIKNADEAAKLINATESGRLGG